MSNWTSPGWAKIPLHTGGFRISIIPPVEFLPFLGAHTSKTERRFAKELLRRSIPFRTQEPVNGGRAFAGGAVVDFDLFSISTLARIQGDYWHTLPGANVKDDQQRITLQNRGYRVVDIWEHDVNTRIDWVMDNLVGGKGI